MQQILNLAHNKSEIERRVHVVIDKFAERGLRSLAVAYQVEIFMLHSHIFEISSSIRAYYFLLTIILLICHLSIISSV